MLARKLMSWQSLGHVKEDAIIRFLCSESGSHDYSIRRQEAKDSLGLNIEKPTDELYSVIKQIYDDISRELELENPYNPAIMLSKTDTQAYSFRRGLIESIYNGTDVYVSEGELVKQMFAPAPGIAPQPNMSDNRFLKVGNMKIEIKTNSPIILESGYNPKVQISTSTYSTKYYYECSATKNTVADIIKNKTIPISVTIKG